VTRTLLCDLDDTLFDHSGATREALAVVRAQTAAFQRWSLDEFDRHHRVVLEAPVRAIRWSDDGVAV